MSLSGGCLSEDSKEKFAGVLRNSKNIIELKANCFVITRQRLKPRITFPQPETFD